MDTEPAPSEEHQLGAPSRSRDRLPGAKGLLLTSTAVGQVPGGARLSSFVFLPTCPFPAMTDVHLARMVLPLPQTTGASDKKKKRVQGAQQKLHSQASRRAETLGPSSAKDDLIFSPVPCAQKDLATPYLSSAFPATFFCSSSLYLPPQPPQLLPTSFLPPPHWAVSGLTDAASIVTHNDPSPTAHSNA